MLTTEHHLIGTSAVVLDADGEVTTANTIIAIDNTSRAIIVRLSDGSTQRFNADQWER